MKTLISILIALIILSFSTLEGSKTLVLHVAFEGMASDTVDVILREDDSPFYVEDSARGFINNQGYGIFNFDRILDNSDFRVTVKHRNSIEIWGNEVTFENGSLGYDFTQSSSQTYGGNVVLKNGRWCMYSGDVNQDGQVTAYDVSVVQNGCDNYWEGYTRADLTGDNFVDGSDLVIVRQNKMDSVHVIKPPYQNIHYPEIHTENVTINGVPVSFFDCDNLMHVALGTVIELDWVSTDIDIIEDEGHFVPDELYDTVYFSPLFNQGTLIFTPPLTHEGHSPIRTHMYLTSSVRYPAYGYYQDFGYARIESYDDAGHESRCFLNFTFDSHGDGKIYKNIEEFLNK